MRLSVSSTAERTAQDLERWAGAIPALLETAAQDLARQAEDQIVAALGAELKAPSGRLARSIEAQVLAQPPAGAAVEVGSDLPYAAVLEAGYSGTEQVSEHLRMMTMAFGRPVPDPRQILVSAYARRVTLPAHHIFSAPLDAMQGDIARRFGEALWQGCPP